MGRMDETLRGALALILMVGAGAGCGAGDAQKLGETREGQASAPSPAVPEGLIAGTPPGGLRDWVAAIRTGTAGLERSAAQDRAAAQRAALDLYIGRQEYLELYYGTAGREARTESLGRAVMDAESRFHALLQLLSAEPVDTAQVRTGVSALHEQLDTVLREAESAGVPVVLPGNVPAGRGSGA